MWKIKKRNKESRASIVGIIHIILLHTYASYFLAIILGVVFDIVFDFHIFGSLTYQYIGLIMIILGSVAVYWAQSTNSPKKSGQITDRDLNFFFRGPYKYTRNPTNLGLTLMSLGLGFVVNSFFSVVFVLLNYLIARFIFIKQQDSILEERYGSIFSDYKKRVRDWL